MLAQQRLSCLGSATITHVLDTDNITHVCNCRLQYSVYHRRRVAARIYQWNPVAYNVISKLISVKTPCISETAKAKFAKIGWRPKCFSSWVCGPSQICWYQLCHCVYVQPLLFWRGQNCTLWMTDWSLNSNFIRLHIIAKMEISGRISSKSFFLSMQNLIPIYKLINKHFTK